MPLPSFIFDAQKETPESLARRRALAEAMLQRGTTGVASNIGEGLAQFGQALAGRIGVSRADSAMVSRRNTALGLVNKVFGGGFGGGTSAAPVAGKAPTAKPTAVKAPPVDGIEGRIAGDLVSQLGLSPAAAAGVVGNLSHETGGFKHMQELKPVVPGSRGGFGWAQWTGPRRKAFEGWAADNKLDPNSYEANLGFLKHELTATPEGRVMTSLKAAKTPEEAARIFSEQYLRPGVPHMDSRIARAQGVAQAVPASASAAPGMNNGDYLAQFGIKSNNPGLMDPQPQIIPASGPPPAMPQNAQPGLSSPMVPQMAPQPAAQPQPAMAPAAPQMAPQRPMTAYQRMMAQSLGKEAGGLAAPPNRTLMASVMGQGQPRQGGGILSGLFTGQGLQAPQAVNSGNSGEQFGQNISPEIPSGTNVAPAGGQPSSAQLQSVIFSEDFAYLPETTQKVLIDRYQRAIEQENPDPAAAADLQLKQLQIQKAQKELQDQGIETVVVGDALVDKRTGKPIYQAPKEVDPDAELKRRKLTADVTKAETDARIAGQPKSGWRPATAEEKKAVGIPEDVPAQTSPEGKVEPLKMGDSGITVTSPDGTTMTIGGGKGGNAALPAEVSGRLGLAARWLETDFPNLLPKIKDGSATGIIDYTAGAFGRGKGGDVQRRMATGVDALRRGLTGAGMGMSETEEYAGRYMPQWTDDAETLQRKAEGLKADLEAVRDGTIVGKTGNLQLLLPGQKGWGKTIDESVGQTIDPAAPGELAPSNIIRKWTPDGGLK
jgi:hypothetical protein